MGWQLPLSCGNSKRLKRLLNLADAEKKGKILVEGPERAWSRKQKLKWVQDRLTNQKSITEYFTKTPAIHIEEGLGLIKIGW